MTQPIVANNTLNNTLWVDLEVEGRSIYQENKHYHQLGTVMEHPIFKDFYENYLESDPELILNFMRTYKEVERRSMDELTPYQKLAIVKRMYDDGPTRRKLFSTPVTLKKLH